MTPPSDPAPCTPHACPHSDNEAERIAALAADGAVEKTFALLGVNVASAADVEAFRQDLRFAGHLRRHTDKAVGGVVTALALGILALIYGGAQLLISGGKP